MKKILIILFYISSNLLAQSNSELIDIGEGGVSWISKNGQFVCGSNYPNPPFLWSESAGRIEVGNVEGEGYSVSNNGIVVGRFRDSSLIVGGVPVLRAGYFTNNQWYGFEGIQGVPPLSDHDFTHAYGINSEGNKAVGMVWHQNWSVEACYWSIPDSGIGLLGQTGNFNSRANVISNDGSIIAGWDGISPGPDRRAFYWDPAPHFMGGFDPTYLVGECRGINSDGSVIVGGSIWPFIWTEATGMQQVVADSSLYFSGEAIGISDNGIIVGYIRFSVQNYRAFIKKPGWNDIILLEDYIPDSLGITNYSSWYFPFADAISADGNRIGITAYPPGEPAHALVLTIDTTIPVELTSFTANIIEKTVLLDWSTATETNNSGFEVQRKSNSQEWEAISFVAGSGTSTETRNYSYSDDRVSAGIVSYRLKQIDYDGSYKFLDEIKVEVSFPNEYNLAQNFPNPFNPNTVIEFSLPENAGNAQLLIYNALGEEVAELLNTELTAGKHTYDWNASGMVSGMYFYELRTDKFVSVKKMMLLK